MLIKVFWILFFVGFAHCGRMFRRGQHRSQPLKSVPSIDYSGCDAQFQCFGLPANCPNEMSCTILLKTQPLPNGTVTFHLTWNRTSDQKDKWVGTALSSDQLMGDDSATLFILGNKIVHEEGLTFVNKVNGTPKSAGVHPFDVKGVVILNMKDQDGIFQAQWNRDKKTTVSKLTFDMSANKYYIFLAYGPTINDTIQHHHDISMSDNSVNLEASGQKTTNGTTKGTTTTPTPPTTTKTPTTKPTPTTSGTTHTSSVTVTLKPTSTVSTSTTVPANSTTTNQSGTTNNSTVTVTEHTGNSTGTTSNTTGSHTPIAPTHKPTKKPGGNASTITLSLMLSIFAIIMFFVN